MGLKELSTKKSLLFLRLAVVSIFIILVTVVYFATTIDMQTRKDTILKQEINHLENTYEVSLHRFKIISDNVNNMIVNKEDILKLLYKAKHTNDKNLLSILRKDLFRKIKPHFDNLKKVGVIITLFSFENNKTFLRVHKPSKFDDNLSKVRYSFQYVNANKKIIRGLEEGKIMHAFRNVYPIFYKGEYLGSVDIAFSSEVLQEHMETLYRTHTHFIINKSVFMTNIWKMKDMVHYIQSLEHKDFLYNVNDNSKDNSFSDIEISLNYKLKEEIYKNIEHKKSFALEDSFQIISFLSIKNIKDKKTVAYLVSYVDSDYLKDIYKEYIKINILSSMIFFIISLFVYKNIKNRLVLNKNLEKEVEDQYKAFEMIFEKASDGIFILEKNKITQCNESVVNMFGYDSENQLIGKSLSDISPELQPDGISSIEKIKTILKDSEIDGVNNFEWKYIKVSGKEFWTAITLTTIVISNRIIIHALIRDISKQKEKEEALLNEKMILDYKANHDVLTMLPNRALFNDRLNQSIKVSFRYKRSFAVLFIDLDKFKPINDTLGHQVGDKVLQEVSTRLKSIIREEDTLARIGGDEFIILMQNLEIANDASILAEKIIEVLDEDIYIDEHVLKISASVGISLYPQNSTSADELLKYADSAMYKAKNEGRNTFQFYTL